MLETVLGERRPCMFRVTPIPLCRKRKLHQASQRAMRQVWRRC